MFEGEPSRADLEVAWKAVHAAGLSAVCGTTLGELGRIAAGNPNYSPAEIRLARSILILRAALIEKETAR